MFKTFLKSTWFFIFLLVFLPLPLCWDFFGNHLINGHDAMGALIRALCMQKYMGHGQFLVRWAPDVNWGYGYPMFNFYPPLFSFISVILFQLTHQMVMAINWACISLWILSGIGMFLFSREYWGKEGGMLSAVLYIYAPYHIIDLYVRGAFAEFSSFVFFPFILLSLYKINRGCGPGYVALGVISVFGLSMAHNIMTMLFLPLASAYLIYLFFIENNPSPRIIPAIGIFILGLMMSAFFWLPAFCEKKFLNLNFLISMRYDFHKSFISLGGLFWPWNQESMDNISFHVGVVHSLLCLFGIIGLRAILKINKSIGKAYIFFSVVALAAIFFTLSYSHLFWENLNTLRFVQFPWRFLTIISFAMSFLGGAVLLLINDRGGKNIALITGVVVIMASALISLPKPVFVEHTQNIEDFVALGEGEYTPKWVLIPPSGRPEQRFEIVHGQGQVADEQEIDPVDYKTVIQAMVPSFVCFHTFYFPGWNILIDGKSQTYLNNPFGLILFFVPPGEHDVEVVLGSTPLRVAGMVISWIGFVLFLGVVLWMSKSKLTN